MSALSSLPLPARFWARVAKSDGCWLWTGATDADGYGRMYIGKKRVGAHRYSLELWRGYALARHEFACHRCDVPACVRPEHLFAGSNAANQIDSVTKGRKSAPRGSRAGTAKLTEQQVAEILAALRRGERQKDLAARYGVSRQPIWLIAHGKGWNHVRRLP